MCVCVCTSVHASERASERACVRACERACVRAYVTFFREFPIHPVIHSVRYTALATFECMQCPQCIIDIIDTGAEDAQGMTAQRRQFHWDKRKRKYVQVSGNDAKAANNSSKRIRTESGKAVDKDKVRT